MLSKENRIYVNYLEIDYDIYHDDYYYPCGSDMSEEDSGSYEYYHTTAIYTYEISSVTLEKPENFKGESELMYTSYPLNFGDKVYVLYDVYSSGDSFSDTSGHLEILYVFNNKEMAEEAEKSILECIKNKKQSVEFKIENGNTVSVFNRDLDYFGSFTRFEIKEFIVS
jgi:hypothetical protein